MKIQFDDPVKQQIWQTLRALNDAWTKGNPDDLAQFFHENMLAITPVDRYRREGRAACVAGWKNFSTQTKIIDWQEVNPVIHVYGDAAVVAYDYEVTFEMNGQTIRTSGRDMFFFIHEDDRWWAVADQFSAHP